MFYLQCYAITNLACFGAVVPNNQKCLSASTNYAR